MPAAANRSTTLSSIPHVIGLTKPSGGGGEYAELIFRICATSVGSPGIQLPMTIRPPGRVTRTISLATSNGRGANIAPKMLTTRSKRVVVEVGQIAGVAFLEAQVREARLLRPPVAGLDEVARDVDAEHVGAEPRGRQRGRAVAAAEVEHLEALR